MFHESGRAKEVFKILDESRAEWSILGGYPRDLHYGLNPKDLDIVVYNIGSETFERETLWEKLNPLMRKDGSGSCAGKDSRVKIVYGLKGGIDIIINNEQYTTAQEVVDDFDYNFNQWKFDLDTGESAYLGDVSESDILKRCVQTKCKKYEIPLERSVHIAIKALAQGWDVLSALKQAEVEDSKRNDWKETPSCGRVAPFPLSMLGKL